MRIEPMSHEQIQQGYDWINHRSRVRHVAREIGVKDVDAEKLLIGFVFGWISRELFMAVANYRERTQTRPAYMETLVSMGMLEIYTSIYRGSGIASPKIWMLTAYGRQQVEQALKRVDEHQSLYLDEIEQAIQSINEFEASDKGYSLAQKNRRLNLKIPDSRAVAIAPTTNLELYKSKHQDHHGDDLARSPKVLVHQIKGGVRESAPVMAKVLWNLTDEELEGVQKRVMLADATGDDPRKISDAEARRWVDVHAPKFKPLTVRGVVEQMQRHLTPAMPKLKEVDNAIERIYGDNGQVVGVKPTGVERKGRSRVQFMLADYASDMRVKDLVTLAHWYILRKEKHAWSADAHFGQLEA